MLHHFVWCFLRKTHCFWICTTAILSCLQYLQLSKYNFLLGFLQGLKSAPNIYIYISQNARGPQREGKFGSQIRNVVKMSSLFLLQFYLLHCIFLYYFWKLTKAKKRKCGATEYLPWQSPVLLGLHKKIHFVHKKIHFVQSTQRFCLNKLHLLVD